MLNVSGVDANSLYSEKSGEDWIIIPNNTEHDDVTYNSSLTATMIDGSVYPGDDYISLLLHVGCPSAAASDNFTLIDSGSKNTTLERDQTNIGIASVTYQSLTQSLPFTCRIQSTY